jgi:hypothetical protein
MNAFPFFLKKDATGQAGRVIRPWSLPRRGTEKTGCRKQAADLPLLTGRSMMVAKAR